EGKAALTRVQALTQKKQTENAAKNKALQDAQGKLQGSGSVLNDVARAQLEKDIEKQQVDLQRFQQDAQAEIQELQQEVQNDSVNEAFFQGHFPGAPLLPAVLMLESLTQVASLLLLHRDSADGARPNARVFLRGVNDARFRRQVVPGDRLRLEIEMGRRRSP